MAPSFDIVRGSAADLDALEPLWVAVHRRHAESMPELRPYVTDAETWAARRALYAELLIESLSVRPDLRGAGIGTVLLDGLERALADDGVTDLVLGVLPGNDAARRLYERRGYRPTWLYLSRLRGRG